MMNTNTDPQALEASGQNDNEGDDSNSPDARQLENMLAEGEEDGEAEEMPSRKKKK